MIQRIQTLYLLLVAVAGALMFFIHLVSLIPEQQSVETAVYHMSMLRTEKLVNGTSGMVMRSWPGVLMNVVVISFSVLVMLQYRNRKKQIRSSHLLLLLVLTNIVLMIYDVEQLRNSAGTGFMLTYNVFSLLPVLQLLFSRLATAAIKKDEELVRSADRLR